MLVCLVYRVPFMCLKAVIFTFFCALLVYDQPGVFLVHAQLPALDQPSVSYDSQDTLYGLRQNVSAVVKCSR